MLNICNVNLTAREREIVDLLRAEPLLDAAAVAERIGSTRAAVSVHLSNLTRKGVDLGRGYLLRPETGSVLVVGGAVLDTKLRTAAPPVLATSNPGTASWTAGGVGRNIAENLARLGSTTTLVTAVGNDLAGESIVGRTAAAGVDCRFAHRGARGCLVERIGLGPVGGIDPPARKHHCAGGKGHGPRPLDHQQLRRAGGLIAEHHQGRGRNGLVVAHEPGDEAGGAKRKGRPPAGGDRPDPSFA